MKNDQTYNDQIWVVYNKKLSSLILAFPHRKDAEKWVEDNGRDRYGIIAVNIYPSEQ